VKRNINVNVRFAATALIPMPVFRTNAAEDKHVSGNNASVSGVSLAGFA
jgi:hypothetical protein